MKLASQFVVVGMAALFITACGGSQEGAAPANFKGIDYPEWVMKGSGAGFQPSV